MNLQFYLEKLHSSKQFKNFMKQNPDAFLCSGFFVIDLEGKDNKQHFDYFVPKEKKLFSFQMEEGTALVPIEMIDKRIPKKISAKHDFDFKEIEKLVEKKAMQEGITNKIQKMLFSLQKLNEKEMLVGTVFISILGMIKIQIDLSQMKIIQFEKKSFFDMMNVLKKK